MQKTSIVRLQMPYSNNPGEYFSFRLKEKLQNEPAQYEASEKIVIVSDIQGDFWAFQRLLVKNGIIDHQHRWTFDDGHLVIAGNCFDKIGCSIECLWLIYSLEEKARRAGGYVHFILGNHEIININGGWRYNHPKYAMSDNAKTVITALYEGNNVLWPWLYTKNVVERIGNILIIHRHVLSDPGFFNYSVAEVNQLVRSAAFKIEILEEPPLLNLMNLASENWGVDTIVTGYEVIEKGGLVFNVRQTSDDLDGLLIRRGRYYRLNFNGGREELVF